MSEITTAQRGVWIDGCHGWHGMYIVIEIAREYGFQLNDSDSEAVAAYAENGPSFGIGHDDMSWDVVHEISEEAETYLQKLAPEGFYFAWNDGDFGLWQSQDEDCAMCASGEPMVHNHETAE